MHVQRKAIAAYILCLFYQLLRDRLACLHLMHKAVSGDVVSHLHPLDCSRGAALMQLLNVHRIRFNPKYCASDSAISWRRSQHVEATSHLEVSTFVS